MRSRSVFPKNTIRGGLLTEEGEGVDEFAQRTYALHINRYISPSITQKVLKVIALSPKKNTVLRWGGGVDYRLMRRGGLMNLLNIYSVMLSKFIPSSSDNTPQLCFFLPFFWGGGPRGEAITFKTSEGGC